MNLYKFVDEIPDWPVSGVKFKDITPLLRDPTAYSSALEPIIKFCRDNKITHIVSPDARGWLFACPVATKLGLPLHLVRKPGKLPPPTLKHDYEYEYATGSLEMKVNALFQQKDRVCIIDDVNATGGTALAVAEMLKKKGKPELFYASFIDLTFLGGAAKLQGAGVKTYSVINYND